MIQEILEKKKKDKSTRKVLVVDDEVKFCDLLKKIFQKNNFLVETAYDGWEAGKKVAEFQPTIMILDITLPGINGLQVCKNLRADSRTENMKIITISGDLRYSESEVFEAGANSLYSGLKAFCVGTVCLFQFANRKGLCYKHDHVFLA
jgi:PleD family two-component response regulator